MDGEPRLELLEQQRCGPPGRVGSACEHRDGAAVVGAGGERALDGELDPAGVMLAAEQEHVDHLPGGLGAAVADGERGPELVEAARPAAAFAFLAQRQ